MGKVYDALRKAESQRKERWEGPVGFGAPLESEVRLGRPAARSGTTAQGGGRGLTGWLRALRRGRSQAVAEDASFINKRRITLLQPNSFVAEQFRSLRARLDSLAAERPLRTVAITSALPGEGKTTASVNLALVGAMGVGRRVMLVDCDLRQPKVHTVLGLRPEMGLAELLTDQTTTERAICKVEGSSLEVLPVRGLPPNPAELLASARMRAVLEELAGSYDLVILDTPPALALPDAKTLSEIVDGVVVIVRAGETPDEDVQATMDLLDRRRVLGVVLNGAAADEQRYGY